MKGLILQLSRLDSDAEAQLRIVDFFDSLLRGQATLENILRATAGLVGVPVGISLSNSGAVIGFDASGQPVDPDAVEVETAFHRMIVRHGREVGQVWLLDDDAASRERDLIMERLVLTCELLWDADELGTEARVVERLLSPSTSEAERRRAARLLGNKFPGLVQVLVASMTSDTPTGETLPRLESRLLASLRLSSTAVLTTRIGTRLVMLAPATSTTSLDAGHALTVAFGPAVPLADALTSLRLAQAALAHAERRGDARHVIRYTSTDPSCLLDLGPHSLIHQDPVIRRLHELLDDEPDLARMVESLTEHGSIRAAAKSLHLHHSSLSTKIDRLEASLGMRIRDPECLYMLRLAVASWVPPR